MKEQDISTVFKENNVLLDLGNSEIIDLFGIYENALKLNDLGLLEWVYNLSNSLIIDSISLKANSEDEYLLGGGR